MAHISSKSSKNSLTSKTKNISNDASLNILKHEISGEDMHDLIHAVEEADRFITTVKKVMVS